MVSSMLEGWFRSVWETFLTRNSQKGTREGSVFIHRHTLKTFFFLLTPPKSNLAVSKEAVLPLEPSRRLSARTRSVVNFIKDADTDFVIKIIVSDYWDRVTDASC